MLSLFLLCVVVIGCAAQTPCLPPKQWESRLSVTEGDYMGDLHTASATKGGGRISTDRINGKYFTDITVINDGNPVRVVTYIDYNKRVVYQLAGNNNCTSVKLPPSQGIPDYSVPENATLKETSYYGSGNMKLKFHTYEYEMENKTISLKVNDGCFPIEQIVVGELVPNIAMQSVQITTYHGATFGIKDAKVFDPPENCTHIHKTVDALHESLKNKFKKERRPLADEEAVSKMKRKFGMAASKRATHSTPAAELQRTNRRATIDDLDFDVGEDDRSIQAHIQTMQTESEKVRPNWAILEDLMKRTCVFRKKYVSSHTTGNVLETFPCLKLPKMLFFDMNLSFKVDVDRMLSTNLQKFASQIINVAGESRLKTQCLETIEECLEDSKRDDLCLSAAIALLPGLFKENLSSLLIMDRMPDIPTPSISVHGCTLQNPLTGRRIIVHMDGYEILKEDVSGDLSFGLSAAFALFFVFGVKYPTDLRKTLLFLEHFIFKLEPSEKIPVTLKRVYNSLCQ